MVRCSNAVVCFVNILTLILAAILICNFTLKTSLNECLNGMRWMLTCIGIFMLVLSMLGIFGSCCRFNLFFGIYIFLLFLVMFIVISLITWTFMNTSTIAGDNASEYKLVESSSWFQKAMTENWKATERCMMERKVCRDQIMEDLVKINNTNPKDAAELTKLYNTLTPIQIGCCKPPSECGFLYVNASSWEVSAGSTIPSTNEDCKQWGNSQDKMCYGCGSCKAGAIVSTKQRMRNLVWVEIVFLVYIDIMYVVAYQAFRNNQDHRD